jgi:galactokinase
MDDETFQRASHVVSEITRPVELADAFVREDLEEAGRLMDQSHASLRDLYEVSSPELDHFTELARAHPACYGARLTGAGFGGCAIALVAADGQDDFVHTVQEGYRARFEHPSSVFTCRAAGGARLL